VGKLMSCLADELMSWWAD